MLFGEKKIDFHDDIDIAFKPLVDYLADWEEEEAEQTLSQYMYMCHDEEKTYYKNRYSRNYFNIFDDGTTEGEIEPWRKWYD